MELLPENLNQKLTEQLRKQVNNLAAVAQLLAPVVRESEKPQYSQYLAILNQSIYTMIRTINHLEYVQLPDEEALPHLHTLDLAGLCRQTADHVRPLAERVQVQFRYEEEKGSLITCGDASLLRRMLLNLIANALHWASKGGEAGLRFSTARDRAVLTVWDNGPGLQAAAEQPESPLQHSDGLGLGLPVARRIAALHGGTLVLEHQEDRGMRAIVSLPMRTPGPESELRTPQMGYDASGGFSPILVELSSVLPFEVFLPDDLE